jgi:hypothetical protein
MANNLMIDIETFGNKQNAVIVSIAAAQFDLYGKGVIAEYYTQVDAQSCEDVGLQCNVSTVTWWLQQSEAARKAVTQSDATPLHKALDDLTDFVHEIRAHEGPVEIWANSPIFDIAILNNAYKASGRESPFAFRDERDWRTITKLFPDIVKNHKRVGDAHRADADVYNQVVILQTCFAHLFPFRIRGCAFYEKDIFPLRDYSRCDEGKCKCAQNKVAQYSESF